MVTNRSISLQSPELSNIDTTGQNIVKYKHQLCFLKELEISYFIPIGLGVTWHFPNETIS